MGIPFQVWVKHTDESYPPDMAAEDVARYLAEVKAVAFLEELNDELVITADTTVVLGEDVLNKPADADEAYAMLKRLSGTSHKVITGVCLLSRQQKISFEDITTVYFRPLDEVEIRHYISEYKPYDKAGSYGIQEWIGMVGIEKIVGSYYNVMGLPVDKLYQHLKTLAS